MTVARPPTVGQGDWDAALAALTERELAAARNRMPMVRVRRDYPFDAQRVPSREAPRAGS